MIRHFNVAVSFFGGFILRSRNKVIRIKKAKFPQLKIIILFFVIFVYFLIYILGYVNRDKASIYRVVSDTRLDDINSIGIILRNEQVNVAMNSGYINYYVNPLSMVAKKDIIYTIDSTGSIYNKLTSEEKQTDLNTDSVKSVLYQYYLNNSEYSSIYNLKNLMKESTYMNSSQNVMTRLSGVIKNYGNNNYFHVHNSPANGIVVYGSDGMEELTVDDINPELFEKAGEHSTYLPPENAEKIDVGTPIYRLIEDETWKIVVPIKEEQKSHLAQLQTVDVMIDDSPYKARAEIEILEKNDMNYVILTLYNYMVNFAEKRFVNVYMILNRTSGLKIAKSSVIEKYLYAIPSDFFVTRTENTSEKGLIHLTYNKDGVPEFKFIETPIYYENDGFSYIAANEIFTAGDRISKIKNVSAIDTEEYVTTISKTESLKGVYNINKGYPEFKRIEIISDIEDDYYLIKDNTKFGLSEYDNIVLNAKVLEREEKNAD